MIHKALAVFVLVVGCVLAVDQALQRPISTYIQDTRIEDGLPCDDYGALYAYQFVIAPEVAPPCP